MKKRLLSLLTIAVLLLSLFSACKKPADNQKAQNPAGAGQSQQQAGQEITAEEAENIALTHAGLTREEVSRLHTEKDFDDGVSYYEVQFEKDRLEYEYEIKAEGGNILSFDKDHD